VPKEVLQAIPDQIANQLTKEQLVTYITDLTPIPKRCSYLTMEKYKELVELYTDFAAMTKLEKLRCA
jgi:hypothetical protein